MNQTNKKDVIEMLGGYARVRDVRDGKSLVSENPIDVVLSERYMNIGNLEALRGRGFEFTGCGITDDGYLSLTFDVKLPKIGIKVER
jgi:hypothetical protein